MRTTISRVFNHCARFARTDSVENEHPEKSPLDLTSFLSFCTAFFSDFPARTWLHIHRHARTPLRFSSELWEQLLAPRQRRRRTKENSHFPKFSQLGKYTTLLPSFFLGAPPLLGLQIFSIHPVQFTTQM